jgi:hypothetical protein
MPVPFAVVSPPDKTTVPEELIRNASTPPSEKAIVSAAGEKIPVLVSPENVNDGAAALPP